MLISLAIGNIVFVDLLRRAQTLDYPGWDTYWLSDLVIDASAQTQVLAKAALGIGNKDEREQEWNTALEAAGLTSLSKKFSR